MKPTGQYSFNFEAVRSAYASQAEIREKEELRAELEQEKKKNKHLTAIITGFKGWRTRKGK